VVEIHRKRPGPLKIVTTLYRHVEHLVHEVAKFGLVGLLGMIVDLPIYNWLVFDNPLIFGSPGDGMLHDRPVTAKFVSVTAATFATYLGNRHWTWRHRERTGLHREYLLFFLLNGIGLLIAAGCLGFSRYVLDLHTALADNIAANFIGLGLGTLFRFWSYRKWVFREELALEEAEARQAGAGTTGSTDNTTDNTGDLPVVR
jgi:putative flippase GtrA